MLENAGALVYTPRERNWQNNEVVVDNDAPEKNGIYKEEGRWHTCDSAGFAHLKDTYYMGDHPFNDGTTRYASTTQSNHPNDLITWIPDIPEDGQYAVYVAYQTLPTGLTMPHIQLSIEAFVPTSRLTNKWEVEHGSISEPSSLPKGKPTRTACNSPTKVVTKVW